MPFYLTKGSKRAKKHYW